MRAPSADRVPEHTDPAVNLRIEQKTVAQLHAHADSVETIDARLRALDQEWDLERALQAGVAALVLGGALLVRLRGTRWSGLSAAAGGCLLRHALQGWCPPLSLLRRAGFRSRREIEHERTALKAMRGDFRWVVPITEPTPTDPDTAYVAARAA